MNIDLKNKFESVYSEESDAIFRFCLLRVSNREQALDITQETFLRLWQSLQKGEDVVSYRAFLFKITRRLIIDWYRKKKSLSLDNMIEGDDGGSYDVADDSTTEERFINGAEGRFLINKINELKPQYRHPLYLRYVEDLSPPEISEVMGISVNAASVRINRGVIELRKIYGYDVTKINDDI